MKVEDIQIGDWVQNPLGVPYQVLAIHFYKINGNGDGYYGIHLKNKGAEARLEIYDLHPVPITPEILEQNGFLQNGVGSEELEELDADWTDDTYIWSEGKTVDDQTMVSVYIDYPKDECIFEAYTPKTHSDGIWIRYVHQLQHALRLLGIKKEIVL